MAVDEKLASQVRSAIQGKGRIAEKKMFGGLTFMLNGNMCVGVNGDNGGRLLVRIDPNRAPELLKRKGARPMDFTGRVMKGYLWVESEGTRTPKALREWVDESAAFVLTLKPKR